MAKVIRAIALAALTSLGLGVGGCAVTSGQQSAGEFVDDAMITSKVKAQFAKDSDVSAMRLNVDTMDGTVQLSGFAASEQEKQKAVRLAREVEGVKKVKDDIVVKPGNK